MPVFPGVEEEVDRRLRQTNKDDCVNGFHYFICPVCRKRFNTPVPTIWAYRIKKKDRILTFCDYKCKRFAEEMPSIKPKHEGPIDWDVTEDGRLRHPKKKKKKHKSGGNNDRE